MGKCNIKRSWYSVNVDGKILGRIATKIANILRGKNKPIFSPDSDYGDFVVVKNAGKIKLTGKKLIQKIDFRNSGYPGGAKYTPYKKLMEKKPEYVLMLAVKGMLPKNKLRARFLKRLKIYKGNEHSHFAQNPVEIEV